MKYGDINIGSKIITLTELSNGTVIIPKGSIGEVKRRYGGLEIYFENRCDHCHYGERVWINKVEPHKVELVKK